MPINDYYSDTVIQIFCKAPIAGEVKTRLMPKLSAEQAASVHRHLSENIIKQLKEAQLCPLQLWCSPDDKHPFFEKLRKFYDISLHIQSPNDLGQRMFDALEAGLHEYRHVLLIGSDCPSFIKQDFIEAITALKQDYDIVIAPVEDGGYSLIGMNRAHIGLFKNMRWSHAEVFKNTLSRAKDLNLRCYQLRQQWDIDTTKDWERYSSTYGKSLENL